MAAGTDGVWLAIVELLGRWDARQRLFLVKVARLAGRLGSMAGARWIGAEHFRPAGKS